MKVVVSTLHIRPRYNPSQEVYMAGLLRGLSELDHGGLTITVLATSGNRVLFPLDGFDVVECDAPLSSVKRILWEQQKLPGILNRLGADVYHAAGNMMLSGFRGPQVVTVHMAMEFRVNGGPKHYAQIAWRKWAINRTAHSAQAVICASEYLKDGLRRVHRLERSDHIHVIPMGVDTDLFNPAPGDNGDAAILSRFGISGPYVFGYADILGLKNVPRILDAWAQLRRQGAGLPVKLVLMGDPASRSFLRRKLTALGELESDVVFPGFVDRRELAALYRGARALVFPSLAESFGLCIIEAMACGTPVLTSTVTAMPEVGGRAALLVDPLDTEQIRDGMDLLVNDEDEHARHARAGLARAREFSWEITARKTLAVYQALAGLARAE